jgi:hypothetical protein
MEETKEMLYVTAIDNLMKKVAYLQSVIQAESGLITEEEHIKELEDNESEYIIRMDRPLDGGTMNAVNDIVPRLRARGLSASDVEEMFSIELGTIAEHLRHPTDF